MPAHRPPPWGHPSRGAPVWRSPRGPESRSGPGGVTPRAGSGIAAPASSAPAGRGGGRGTDPAAIPPASKLRAGERRRYRLCSPPPARYPEGADVVKVLVTRRGGRIKRLVLGSWPVSVPADVRCVLPPWPRRAVYGAAAIGWARGQLRASRRPGGKRVGWSTERNLRKVARGERPLMVDLWARVHAWLSPPPAPPRRPLVPLRVRLFGGGRPAIVRGLAEFAPRARVNTPRAGHPTTHERKED